MAALQLIPPIVKAVDTDGFVIQPTVSYLAKVGPREPLSAPSAADMCL